jgi:transcriptional regulator GlxA family with amidase domain
MHGPALLFCFVGLNTHICIYMHRTALHWTAWHAGNKIAWDWVCSQGPTVKWRRQARWVDAGTIITSSGVAAGIDATLYAVKTRIGAAEAQQAAREIEYVPRTDAGNDPFSDPNYLPPV